MTGIKNKDSLITSLDKIKSIFNRPFRINSHEVFLNASFGVAVFPDDGREAEELLRKAELALKTSREIGEGAVSFYSREMELQAVEEVVLKSSMKEAIEREEFFLCYQPILRLSDCKIVGIEALVRWKHPEFGIICPIKFIPIAERTGLIRELGNFVLDKALRDLSELQREGFEIFVAVNFSMKQFNEPNLERQIEEALRKYSISPEKLLFEITESTAMEDPEKTKKNTFQIERGGHKGSHR